MNVLRVKEWLTHRKNQFIAISYSMPNTNIYEVKRLKDNAMFKIDDAITINGYNWLCHITGFSKDNIHVKTTSVTYHSMPINEII